ncbi:hypothetical protein [Legionella brunensis]|nr:hypothetical protein [Legionella brunensis]
MMIKIITASQQLSKIQITAIYNQLGTKASFLVEQLKSADLIYDGNTEMMFHGKSVMLSSQ